MCLTVLSRVCKIKKIRLKALLKNGDFTYFVGLVLNVICPNFKLDINKNWGVRNAGSHDQETLEN